MTTQKLPPEIEKLVEDLAENRRKIMTKLGHPLHGTIAHQNFHLGFEAGALAVLEQADKLTKTLEVAANYSGVGENYIHSLDMKKIAAKALTEWRKFRGWSEISYRIWTKNRTCGKIWRY